ncbi:SpoIIE family protein phosphatase [Streptomyces sp. NPDC001941]|uniref:SpoIIE family protein phosphatase n=1 Tax=Streptomyces sp. NPDC001941 TaxID=3154659 RepID=UPI00331D22CC
MENFARLTAGVLGAWGAVVASAASLPGGEVDVEVVGSWPSGWAHDVPEFADVLRRVAGAGRPRLVECAAGVAARRVGCEAFVAVPVRGRAGELLGVLAAFETEARSWSDQNLRDLTDLADACAAELRLRAGETAPQATRRGAREPGHAAAGTRWVPEESIGQAHEGARALKDQLDRSELLLRAAELLADTSGLGEVRRTVSELVSGDLKPAYVGLVLREDDQVLRREVDAVTGPVALEQELPRYGLSDAWPSAQAARENRIVAVPDRQTLIEGYAPQTVAVFDAMGLDSAVCVPLPGPSRAALGTLVVAWDEPHETDVYERAVLTVIAGYTALAVQRALRLDERVSVARQLQQAMLTALPQAHGLELAALYRPASKGDMVGGDWYDAYPLPGERAAGEERRPWAVTVGDITGHNTRAATLMRQARSMLRQADVDRAGSPGAAVASVERANEHLGTGISGTLVHAHLLPRPEGSWLLRWINAGHPPPLLARPGQAVEHLSEHGRLLFPGLTPREGRPVYERVLEPGSVLVMYTDGLVEKPARGLEETTAHAARLLGREADEHTPLPRLLDLLADTLAGREHTDDVVLLALRVVTPGAT